MLKLQWVGSMRGGGQQDRRVASVRRERGGECCMDKVYDLEGANVDDGTGD